MMQRDLLAAGIKILGLCLLALGLFSAGRNGIVAFTSHWAHTHFPEPWISEDVPAQIRAEVMYRDRPARELQKFTLRLQRTGALQNLALSVVQIVVGLAMVRRETWLLRFMGAPAAERTADSRRGT
jgi:hypothetical protein